MSWKITFREEMPKGDNPMGNRFYGYHKTGLLLPDGRSATYQGLLVGACVHIVGIDEDETTYLVRQSRPNLLRSGDQTVPETLELPGGFANENMSREDSARSEFAGEVGLAAASILQIGTLYPSPGVSNEQDHIFLATDLSKAVDNLEKEATEQDMRVIALPFGQAFDLLTSGRAPVAAQTLAAMALAARHL